jgi:hypothetical protein
LAAQSDPRFFPGAWNAARQDRRPAVPFQAISNLDGFFPTRSASYANSFADIF